MAYALVGTAGTVVTGTGTLSPAFGTGETRAAGNLLICWVYNLNVTTQTTPSGWTLASQIVGSVATHVVSIFYKIATGGDAGPSVAVSGTSAGFAQVAEFSGGATASPVDQIGSGRGTASQLTVTNAAADAAAAELVVYSSGQNYSATATKTNSMTANNSITTHDTNNNATSGAAHYVFGWGIATGGGTFADNTSLTFTITKINEAETCMASFRLGPQPQLVAATVGATASVAVSGLLVPTTTAVPDADTVTTGWAATPLFSKVNDGSDATVITATLA